MKVSTIVCNVTSHPRQYDHVIIISPQAKEPSPHGTHLRCWRVLLIESGTCVCSTKRRPTHSQMPAPATDLRPIASTPRLFTARNSYATPGFGLCSCSKIVDDPSRGEHARIAYVLLPLELIRCVGKCHPRPCSRSPRLRLPSLGPSPRAGAFFLAVTAT